MVDVYSVFLDKPGYVLSPFEETLLDLAVWLHEDRSAGQYSTKTKTYNIQQCHMLVLLPQVQTVSDTDVIRSEGHWFTVSPK